MNFQLVQVAEDGEPRASTEALALGYSVQHKNVLSLLKRHAAPMAALGEVAFETRLNAQGSPTEYAMLNERQAMLMLTLMRNTEKVVGFKLKLIQEFYRLAEALRNRDLTLWDRRLRFEAKDQSSRKLGTFGSRLMHDRRKEKPQLDAERYLIESAMEQPLFIN